MPSKASVKGVHHTVLKVHAENCWTVSLADNPDVSKALIFDSAEKHTNFVVSRMFTVDLFAPHVLFRDSLTGNAIQPDSRIVRAVLARGVLNLSPEDLKTLYNGPKRNDATTWTLQFSLIQGRFDPKFDFTPYSPPDDHALKTDLLLLHQQQNFVAACKYLQLEVPSFEKIEAFFPSLFLKAFGPTPQENPRKISAAIAFPLDSISSSGKRVQIEAVTEEIEVIEKEFGTKLTHGVKNWIRDTLWPLLWEVETVREDDGKSANDLVDAWFAAPGVFTIYERARITKLGALELKRSELSGSAVKVEES